MTGQLEKGVGRMDRNQLWDKVIARVDGEAVVDLARRALMIPSLSGQEENAARFFFDAMRRLGIEAELQPVPECPTMNASWNVIGRVKGKGEGKNLILNGHMDHNPTADGWTKDPFGGVIEDGWLYGFVHMKAADACFILAADAVRKAGVELKGDLVIALVAGELRGGVGTRHALASGVTGDYFVVGEPSELEIVTRHTGSVTLKLHVLGKMKHFATRDVPGAKGINAIEKMAKVLPALGPCHKKLPSRRDGGWLTFEPDDNFSDLPQYNIGSIRGGIGRDHNTTRPALLADRCTLQLDVRIVPGMTKHTIEADLRHLLDGFAAEDPDFRYEIELDPDSFPLPFAESPESEAARCVIDAHRHINGKNPVIRQTANMGATDALWLSQAGLRGLIYGPTGRYLSRPDERCEIEDLVRATKAYACVIADICTRDR